MPSTPGTNEVARRDETPTVLEYGSPPVRSSVARILASIAVATLCFASAHLVAEAVTGYLATFKFQWLGPASSPRQLAKLQDEYLVNIITEIVWLIPAIAVVFVIQLGSGLRGRGKLRSRTWAICLAVGVCYCWARWGLWGLCKAVGFPFPESVNFLSSMLFAAVGGVALAAWRGA